MRASNMREYSGFVGSGTVLERTNEIATLCRSLLGDVLYAIKFSATMFPELVMGLAVLASATMIAPLPWAIMVGFSLS